MTRRPALPALYRLVTLDTVDSTNDEAKRLAAAAVGTDGTVVWSLEQSAGRGRRGRHWASPRGNLYCSLLLSPDVPMAATAQLGFVAALATADAVRAFASTMDHTVNTKWPNDVLLNGRKVAGILMETQGSDPARPDWAVIGIGLNVKERPLGSEAPATSLRHEGIDGIAVVDALECLCCRFRVWAERWKEEGFAPIRGAWLARAAGRGREILVRLENETQRGTFDDIDADGALILGLPGGRRRIAAGDVFLSASEG